MRRRRSEEGQLARRRKSARLGGCAAEIFKLPSPVCVFFFFLTHLHYNFVFIFMCVMDDLWIHGGYLGNYASGDYLR